MTLQKVDTYIRTHGLLQSGRPVVVGVSGGADSVALWHILHALGYECIVAHCNFHLRGEEADRDERFVRRLAETHHTPYCQTDFDTAGYAAHHSISIEMAARDLRYNWFAALARERGAQAVAVAHHADDHIETMLMHLIRGTGLRGLTGIPVRNGLVVRPLLCCTRREVEDYLTANRLEYVTDSTNLSQDYTRNKIRHALLPLLESINPAVRQTLYAEADRFGEAYTLYRQSIDRLTETCVTPTPSGADIDIDRLTRLPAFRSVLFEALRPWGFTPPVIDQVAAALHGEPGRIFLSPTHRLLKDRTRLLVRPRTEDGSSDTACTIAEGMTHLDTPIRLRLTLRDKEAAFRPSKAPRCVHLDADTVRFPLTLRHWREGDTFHPFGMKGQKKVSDFLTDLKLSRFDKEQCRVLTSGDDIVWVIGLRPDDRFKVTDRTTRVLEVAWEE